MDRAPALAAVLDACASYGVARRPAVLTARVTATAPSGPRVAARLLGAAHAVRGAFDESSLDAPAARDAARQRRSARSRSTPPTRGSTADSTYQTALDLAHAALSST